MTQVQVEAAARAETLRTYASILLKPKRDSDYRIPGGGLTPVGEINKAAAEALEFQAASLLSASPTAPQPVSDMAQRLRAKAADLVDVHGETMKRWDKIRWQVQTYKGSDLPRMNFEQLMDDFAELMNEAAATIEAQPASQWRDIVSAPFRKTVILGQQETDLCVTAYRSGPVSGWRHAHSGDSICFEPTHYQPLPAPPESTR